MRAIKDTYMAIGHFPSLSRFKRVMVLPDINFGERKSNDSSNPAGNLNTHLHINDVVLGGTLRYLGHAPLSRERVTDWVCCPA